MPIPQITNLRNMGAVSFLVGDLYSLNALVENGSRFGYMLQVLFSFSSGWLLSGVMCNGSECLCDEYLCDSNCGIVGIMLC